MEHEEENTIRFETQIKFKGKAIKLEEIDENMLWLTGEPTLPREGDNYDWQVSLSIDPDTKADAGHDAITCYLNAELNMKGDENIIHINTLHTYHVPKLNYKQAHTELFKDIARESVQHANLLLAAKAKGTVYEGFAMPPADEDWLNEDAREWNRRYIPFATGPDENALGRKLSKVEIDEMTARANELVEFIDAYDEDESEPSEEEVTAYWTKYAEWSKINKRLNHFKLIARNNIAYIITKMMAKMEAGLKKDPDNFLLRETYGSMKDDYNAFMNEMKDEFAKN